MCERSEWDAGGRQPPPDVYILTRERINFCEKEGLSLSSVETVVAPHVLATRETTTTA